MKPLRTLNLMILFLLFFFLSASAWGQQNLFNIPSGQLTPKGKLFYQHQLNAFSPKTVASKQHFAVGLTDSLEAGINFINFYPLGRDQKDKEDNRGPEDNILAPTLQKSFALEKDLVFNIGTIAGLSHLGLKRSSYPTAFTYGVASYYSEPAHLRVTGGPWISGSRFNGPGDKFGVMAGFEWMYGEGWYLMGDWISGDTKNSVSVIGGMVDALPGLQICYGYLLPNPRSEEGRGVVLEINLFTL